MKGPMKGPKTVGALRAKVGIDDELEWFFNCAESEMGDQSNYLAMLGRNGPGSMVPSPEAAVVVAHRARRVRGWLRAMGPSRSGVLQCAYELRNWPIVIWDALGRLTGVVVRLACALDDLSNDRRTLQLIEMARADWLAAQCPGGVVGPTVVALRREAQSRFSDALREYSRVREEQRTRCS